MVIIAFLGKNWGNYSGNGLQAVGFSGNFARFYSKQTLLVKLSFPFVFNEKSNYSDDGYRL
ncbi:hypothetical protein A4G17_09475 [Frederiksenia canicola]|uniref:Uncharacterized protein n=1 Tax=Frederiksenia canicola TaxID=123824 RepID=A0AAE6X904_9PAST|nr:hypothetical protein A4G17_09475 [Frederiksenia canicola]